MKHDETVFMIEKKFRKVLRSLSVDERKSNRRLRDKTKKVAELLAMVAEVRRDLARKAAEAAQGNGACT